MRPRCKRSPEHCSHPESRSDGAGRAGAIHGLDPAYGTCRRSRHPRDSWRLCSRTSHDAVTRQGARSSATSSATRERRRGPSRAASRRDVPARLVAAPARSRWPRAKRWRWTWRSSSTDSPGRSSRRSSSTVSPSSRQAPRVDVSGECGGANHDHSPALASCRPLTSQPSREEGRGTPTLGQGSCPSGTWPETGAGYRARSEGRRTMADPMEEAKRKAEADAADNRLIKLVESLGGTASAKAVFGEPVEKDGVTVVPVARVRFGVGGGGGRGPGRRRGVAPATRSRSAMATAAASFRPPPAGYIELSGGKASYKRIGDPARPMAVALLFPLSGRSRSASWRLSWLGSRRPGIPHGASRSRGSDGCSKGDCGASSGGSATSGSTPGRQLISARQAGHHASSRRLLCLECRHCPGKPRCAPSASSRRAARHPHAVRDCAARSRLPRESTADSRGAADQERQR